MKLYNKSCPQYNRTKDIHWQSCQQTESPIRVCSIPVSPLRYPPFVAVYQFIQLIDNLFMKTGAQIRESISHVMNKDNSIHLRSNTDKSRWRSCQQTESPIRVCSIPVSPLRYPPFVVVYQFIQLIDNLFMTTGAQKRESISHVMKQDNSIHLRRKTDKSRWLFCQQTELPSQACSTQA